MMKRLLQTLIKPLYVLATSLLTVYPVVAAELLLHQSPLYLATAEKSNVLVILDNSNSMDEAANGSAVGGTSPSSKSEIARSAVKSMISSYSGTINMGLMAYQQTNVVKRHLHNAPYDASFNSDNYDASFTGARDSAIKRYRVPNVSNSGSFVYYNVALPFYSNNNEGNAYCYSSTASFDNGGETIANGPWDSYRCFSNKDNESDTLPVWQNTSNESTRGFTSLRFQTTFVPTDSDFAQNILDFGRFLTWDWVSETWFSNSSPGRGFLHTPIAELDATQTSLLHSKLATSQFSTNSPMGSSWPLQNAGLTPLEGTLKSAKDYFADAGLPTDEGGPVSALPESCGKDYIALLTDGLPSTTANGTTTSDPVAALADVATVAGELNTSGVETYMIGFALPVGTDSTALDTIAAAGGTGSAYYANDLSSLGTQFNSIFTDILAKTGASSSAATNSTSLSTNSHIYQAKFNSEDWKGQLLAKSISIDGQVNTVVSWEAGTVLDSKLPGNRVILTYGRDTRDGIPFRWADINTLTDTTAKDALNTNASSNTDDGLGSSRVDFIRGTSESGFRTNRSSKLGDIVHSTPFYVGPPAAGYSDSEMPGYNAFRTTYKDRTPMLFSGANDGMLHGFNATVGETSSGEEILAYVPREVFPNLSKLTDPQYGKSALPHHYFVDGAPMMGDAYVGGAWKTILAGGLRAGGQGVYALDITNPDNFSESLASDIVLWEFSDEDDADLGFTFVSPTVNNLTQQSAQIAKMANGKWAVILGNGYNNTAADGDVSTTGHAYLFILFIEDGTDGTWTLGTDYIKIDTGIGDTVTPNGMATPTPVDTDGDGDVDLIYAGDLRGNLWKFDVSDSTPANWGNAITGVGDVSLFHAEDSSNPQPITTAPLVTGHPEGGYMIGFGTGKYMELADVSTTDTHSFYGLWDDESNTHVTSVSAGGWIEQTVIATQTINGNNYRFSSQALVDYTDQANPAKGWYMNLPTAGERIDVNPIIRDGRFVFATRIPSVATCEAGGSSWLMELDYLSGSHLDSSPFDVGGDGKIDENDKQKITITNKDGLDEEIEISVSGFQEDGTGMLGTPAVLETDTPEEEYKILADSEGNINSVLESAQTTYKGRVSWEEIR